MLDRLTVRRRFATSAEPHLGYEAEVPSRQIPTDAPSEDLEEQLGWRNPVPAGSAIARIDPVGLLEPTPWERRYVRWLSEALGAPVTPGWDLPPKPRADSASSPRVLEALLGLAPLSPVEPVPAWLHLQRAASALVEARATTADLRAWLVDQPDPLAAADQVLVLLPSDPERVALWCRELERADLPVRATIVTPLGHQALARWVAALTALAGWSDQAARSRGLIEQVFTASWWSATQARRGLGLGEDEGLGRSLLREAVAALRRPAVTLDAWCGHLDAMGRRPDQPDWKTAGLTRWATFSRALAQALRTRRAADLRRLLDPHPGETPGVLLGVQATVGRLKDDGLSDTLHRVLAIVDTLERDEAVALAEGHEPDAQPLEARLEDALSGLFAAERKLPARGVTLLSYDLYDGRASSRLVLAGLEEGGYPAAPTLPTAHDEAWLTALELPEDRRQELERQVRVTVHALGQCDGEAIASFCQEGSGTEVRHPGSMLSLLVGTWTDEDWARPCPGRRDVARAAELPRSVDDVACWTDLRLLALEEPVAEALGVVDAAPARLVQAPARLRSSVRATASRRPEQADARLGPWTGRLPGPTEAARVYSATALESYGQCGMKYLLGRVLHLEEPADAAEEPDAMQSGSLLHAALARLTQRTVDVAVPRLLEFDVSPDAPGGAEAWIDRLHARLVPWIRTGLREAAQEEPTFCGPLLDRIGDRWSQSVRNWLNAHVREAVPADLEGIDALPDVARQLAALQDLSAQRARLAQLGAAVEAGSCGGQKDWLGYLVKGALTQTALKQAWRDHRDGVALDDVLGELRDGLDDKVESAETRRDAARSKERARRQGHLAHAAAHAELAFGFGDSQDSDSDPCSSPDPIGVPAGAPRVRVKGQIDRVDWDVERGTLAVRDYKSGQRMSVSALQDKVRDGRHLQLLLYAEALQALIDDGRLPHLASLRVQTVALEWLKKPGRRDSGTELRLTDGSGLGPVQEPDGLADAECDYRELGRLWLASHAAGIEAGRHDLLPTACPMTDSGAWCDFERICGFQPAFAERFGPRPGPLLGPLPMQEAAGDDTPEEIPGVLPPSSDATVDPAEARAAHEQASLAIADPSTDAVVSAGAGTGKTWNLVRRYEAALWSAPVPEPQRILCVTFTRRAAAEMKARIRAALLDKDDVDPAQLRGLILDLSAAPISTLDALALRIVQERDAFDGTVRPAEVSETSALSSDLAAFVSERFLEAIEAGDERLDLLLDAIAPAPLRAALRSAVGADLARALEQTPDADSIEALWRALVQPYVDAALVCAQSVDVAQGRVSLAATKSITDDKSEEITALLTAGALLQAPGSLTDPQLWAAIRVFFHRPRKSGLNQPLKRWFEGEYYPEHEGFIDSLTPQQKATWKELLKGFDLQLWARLMEAATSLAADWSADFAARLRERGTLRYGDVEQLAIEALTTASPELRLHLRTRLPFHHIFVDEAQDTSRHQVRLVEALRDLRDDDDPERARLFWVGDPKQSIYRFRGAEVDVFEGLTADGDGRLLTLQTNRRSVPPLIRSVNRLFGALLPARADGRRLDPGSEVDYRPLTWTEEADSDADGPPAIELIAAPGAGWNIIEQDEEPPEPEAGDQPGLPGAEATPAEKAICRRIAALLADLSPDQERWAGAPIALLVHAWSRAERYRALLERLGIPAVVQGGRGLLARPEVDGLVLWLEAALRRSDVGLVGALRGPGVALSDAGLVCLRRGWGLRDPATGLSPARRPGLRAAATGHALDATAATAQWSASLPFDNDLADDVLELDQASLARFRATWSGLQEQLTTGSLAGAIEFLVDALDWEAWWHSRPLGRQAVANVYALVRLVRQTEASLGSDGAALLRAFDAMRDSDDPAAGGLDAGHDASVVITTFWQAKGLEWPIVVLPDLEKTSAKSDSGTLGAERVPVPGLDGLIHVPELKLTDPTTGPFEVRSLALKSLLDDRRKPVLRAELRRLLYVAMTRARDRLVLGGVFSAPRKDKASWDGPDGKRVSLDVANNWASTLMVCTALSFDEDGRPLLGDGAWSDQDVVLRTPGDLLEEPLDPPDAPEGPGAVDLGPRVAGWRPIVSEPVELFRPSSARSDRVPLPLVEPAWPTDSKAHPTPFGAARHEGTAFHLLMELWGFGASGRALDDGLAGEVLDRLGMRPHPREQQRIDRLLALVSQARTDQPDLFERLERAAAAGHLLHEVPLRFIDHAGRLVTGQIDLMWHEDGAWHVLDYKAGWAVATASEGLDSPALKKNHGQVELYREGARQLLGQAEVATTGLWYVSRGLVVQWA